jgi:hypothetical protein
MNKVKRLSLLLIEIENRISSCMVQGLSIFALMIGAALFIAQMPFHSEAAPVDEPQFLSIDVHINSTLQIP